jgi:SAM-dependent methyltransferase
MTAARAAASMDAAARLGDILRGARYGPETLAGVPGLVRDGSRRARFAPGREDTSILGRRLPSTGTASTLLRLFLCGAAVAPEAAASALRPVSVNRLMRAGILGRSTAGVRSRVRIGWCDGVLVVSDWERGRLGRDHVAGVGPASVTLADLTVRLPDVHALDLGTGGGVQALLTAAHAASVVGTDLNPRALDLAAVGAALNGTANVEWRQGSLFEPVAGERFDLVIANPPFVISPEVAHVFRDGGQVGDSISRCVVQGAAGALRPGGWASVLCSWIHPIDGDWAEPVRRWVEGSGCDAWILRHRTDDPVTYASVWASQAGAADGLGRTVDRWLAYYAELGIDAVATGAVVLHRTDGPGRIWWDDMSDGPSGPAGEQLVRAFAHRARLAAGGTDAAILDGVPVPLDGATLDQSLVRRGGAYQAAGVTLRLQPGLGLSVVVPPEVLPVVLAFDGQRSTERLIHDTGATGVSGQVIATVRRIVELGLAGWRPSPRVVSR